MRPQGTTPVPFDLLTYHESQEKFYDKTITMNRKKSFMTKLSQAMSMKVKNKKKKINEREERKLLETQEAKFSSLCFTRNKRTHDYFSQCEMPHRMWL